MMQILGVRATA